MAKEYFCCYHSYLKSIEPLNDAERGRLFTACLLYSGTGEVPELRGNERFIFPMMKEQIDRDAKRYEDRCEQNRQNVLRRYTDVDDRIQTPTKSTKEKAKEKEKEKAKEKENREKETSRATRFTPPTVSDVASYCLERGNHVDAERFVDFYAAKGWRIGSNPMKDWKAAVRTWERREDGRVPGNPGKTDPGKKWNIRYDVDGTDL